MDILHRTLDDTAPEERGVDNIVVTRVYGHVGYGTVHSRLLEEDQVSGAEVRLLHAAPYMPLPDGVIRHRHPLAEDQAREAGAVLRVVCRARSWRRVPVRGAEVRPRPFDHLRVHDVAARCHLPATRGCAVRCRLPAARVCAVITGLGSGLGACDDHDGVGDYPAFGLRASGDLHGKAVASVHLVSAEPHPDAAVSPLVDCGLPHPRGGAYLEVSRRVVALRGRPASVDGIETVRRNPYPEPGRGHVLRRPDVSVISTVPSQSVVTLLPVSRRVKAPGRSIIDDLRVGGGRLHDLTRPRRCPYPGVRPLRRRTR